jgi:hypothetical protein
MNDEQRLQMITDQLILVRDNLFRGMSKSIQKLQARSINEVLELENFTQSPQRQWVGLTDEDVSDLCDEASSLRSRRVSWIRHIEAKLKEKNT